jgi:glutaconyl-CoA decarboxylase
MKRRFRITVEGESYEVEVEELAEARTGPPIASARVSAPAPAAAPAPAKTAPAAKAPPPSPAAEAGGGGGGEVVSAPMPGTIVSIRVKGGDEVKTGDVLLILDSMKIQNEIRAPREGKIKEVLVSEGKYVRRREPLIAIEG